MPLSYDAQQQDFISSVTGALSRHCPMSLVRSIGGGDAERWTEIWTHVAAMGLPSLLIPEADGGLELGVADLVAVLEATGHFALPAPVMATMGGFVALVVAAGGDGQALEQIVAGAAATIAPTMSADGSAVLADGRLTVHCDGIPEPGRAELIAIPAVRDSDVVLVVAAASDVGIVAHVAMDPASPVGSLHLDEWEVGDATVLEGDPRPGLAVMWTGASAELVGLAAELVRRSASYAADRVQFGRPIGAFQGVKHLLVDVHVAVERARSLTLYAALLCDGDDPRATVAAHHAKAAASEAGSAAARAAVQVHGGSGITVEEDVSLMYLRARQLSQLLGDADVHFAAV